jgi:ornithine carbamoyltransferase
LSLEDRALLEQARVLQRAAQSGRVQPLLRGKHLGLLCDNDTLPAAALFRRAASELGAHVAHIGVSLSERSPAQDVAHTARMLGRLYDAIECEGMEGKLVAQVADLAGIPVFDGIATDEAWLARMALLLGPESALEENRRYALQARLLLCVV